MAYAINLNGVEEIGPRDRDGATSLKIEERGRIFTGNRDDCVARLKEIAVGTSVTVRYPGGQRSCMNKPALWDAVAANPEAI